ncbi:alpha/beta fold hydrolase [Actinopolymorpha rutila]|uniref:Pimeloyl-ACP methyl ester carboxylesterase n=1 Tax=Actinopolymorpha rutila TaxID=446787 RepID=A0A852ZX41_9ACTN|nr:alpha/beta fold hydrolase [Actinopolymorpha rutila]NYH93286.1 pimeloyl-ACP methyl ester carboxylesterase [Actinopolymorpha rutila]
MRAMPYVEGVEHRFVEAGGVRFHVAEAGPAEGTPVLFLHGFPQHWYAWRHVVPLLAGRHRLIMPDFRGFGWSDAPYRGYDTGTRADDVLALMDALELDRVLLVGHEWGAWVGFMACIRAPERFDRFLALSMIHPWPEHRRLIRHAWRQWYTIAWEYPVIGGALLRHWPTFTRYILRRGVTNPDVWRRADLDEFTESVRARARAHAGRALHWQYVLRDIPRLLIGHHRALRLTVPTTLLFGTDDFAMSPEALAGGERHATDLVVRVVPGGHYLADEQPGLVADAIRSLSAGSAHAQEPVG